MYNIIGGDGKQYGPISADQIRAWLAEGRLNANSSIQSDADPQWKPLHTFSEFQMPCSGNVPASATVAPKTCGLAIASFVCGLVSLLCGIFAAIPGLILGIVGLGKINRSGGTLTGKGFAIAGICLSGIFLIVGSAIIAAIMLPALTGAREQARTVACMSHMKQLSMSTLMYANENKDKLPDAANWCDTVKQNVGNSEKVFQCPTRSGQRCAYVFNRNLSGKRLDSIQNADRTVLIFEGTGGWNASGTATDLPGKPPHSRGYNIVFVDGHAETVSKERLNELQWQATN